VLVYSGATAIKVKGVEADDVIGWCSTGLQGSKMVYTNDHDLLALASMEDTTILLKAKYQETDLYDVDKKVEIPFPLRYVTLYKSLVGDTSDEYGGVKQFGPAKWNDLYAVVGDAGLDELVRAVTTRNYSNLKVAVEHESTPKSVKKSLSLILADTSNWQVMYAIASIRPELCWKTFGNKLTQPEFRKRVPSKRRVEDLMKSVGCDDVYSEWLAKFMPTEVLIHKDNWSEDMPARLASKVAESPLTAYDYEGYDTLQHPAFQEAKSGKVYIDVLSIDVTGGSICFGDNCQHSVYLTVNHDTDKNLEKKNLADMLASIRDACRVDSKPFVAHNATFEMAVSVNSLGIEMWDSHDSMILSQEVDENERSGLKHLATTYLKYRQTSFEEVVPEGKTMKDVTPEDVLHYGCDDSLVTAHLYWLEMIQSQLESTYDFYCEYNVSPLNVLACERLKGINMDWAVLNQIKEEDAAVHESSRKTIEELLHQNLDKNSDGDFIAQIDNANRYFAEEKEYYYCKARHDAAARWEKLNSDQSLFSKTDLSDEEQMVVNGDYTRFISSFVEERIDKVKGDLLHASMYKPYKKETVGAKFLPTAAGLRDLSKALDLPVVEKATKGYLNLYVDDNWQAFKSDDQKEFARILESLIPIITSKTREEPEFAEMAEFAIRVMGLEPKEVETGFEVTTSSTVKSRNLLYLLLGSEVYVRGKTTPKSLRRVNRLPGSPSTDVFALRWADANTDKPWVKDVLSNLTKMSAAATRSGLFHKKWPMWRHPDTGNIHPEFRWSATATGRPTGGNPNFLQISSVMRQAVVPAKEGDVLVGIDWAGLELRLTAGQCEDPEMLRCYIPRSIVPTYKAMFGEEVASKVWEVVKDTDTLKDLHSITGAKISGKSYDEFYKAYKDASHPEHNTVDNIRKKKGKAVNFGLIYGMSYLTLAIRMIIDRHESEGYVNAYFASYKKVKPWQEETEGKARREGRNLTAYGTVRHAEPELFTGDKPRQSRIARQLVNSEIQGTAADLLKITMTKMWKSGLYNQCGVSYSLPIYDEILNSVDKESIHIYIQGMKHIMEVIVPTKTPVPMEVDVAVGYDWLNMAELEDHSTDVEFIDSKLVELKKESKELHLSYDAEEIMEMGDE